MKVNRNLAILAVVLLALSGWTYYASVHRAERFERGQKFLPQLNPDEIATVVIEKGGEGGEGSEGGEGEEPEETRLRRKDDRFVVVSENGYPAANDAVNRFLRNVLEIELEKEVGRGESLEKRLGFKPADEEAGDALPEGTVRVSFLDGTDKEMVRFLVAEGDAEQPGSYVLRASGEKRDVYLTSQRVFLTTEGDAFLDKAILDLKPAEITAIRGDGWEIVRQEGELHLADVPAGKKESSKVHQAGNMLSGLRFQSHHLADDPELGGLAFPTRVEVDLGDGSGYNLALGEKDGKHYLRVQAFHEAERVSIAVDADEEEVKETAELLERVDQVEQFNRLHGSWIYEVSEGIANKIGLERSELLEDA